MDELGILKIRLENAIAGHEIAMHSYPDSDTYDMLILLKDCLAVISRIEPVGDEE